MSFVDELHLDLSFCLWGLLFLLSLWVLRRFSGNRTFTLACHCLLFHRSFRNIKENFYLGSLSGCYILSPALVLFKGGRVCIVKASVCWLLMGVAEILWRLCTIEYLILLIRSLDSFRNRIPSLLFLFLFTIFRILDIFKLDIRCNLCDLWNNSWIACV